MKSRDLSLKSGNKNTTFFHNSMKIRQARNQIEQIQVDGQEIKEAEELKIAAHNYFKDLLTANDQQAVNEDFLQHINKK